MTRFEVLQILDQWLFIPRYQPSCYYHYPFLEFPIFFKVNPAAMEVPSGKVFEVLVRNPRGVAKIADIALTLTVREVVIQSGVLVFEGVRVDVSDSGAVDHVTFARTGTAIEGLEILANTYGAFRACPSRESPTTEPRGSFSLFKPGGVRFATFSYPWAGKPVKEVDGWSKGTNIYGDPCEAYSDGIFNVTYETKIHQAQFPDVLVVGSGPLGATYARKIVEAGHGVLMVEMGAQYDSSFYSIGPVSYQSLDILIRLFIM